MKPKRPNITKKIIAVMSAPSTKTSCSSHSENWSVESKPFISNSTKAVLEDEIVMQHHWIHITD